MNRGLHCTVEYNNITKKCSERRKHCALAVVRRSQKFSPRHRPLPGGAGRPKFNQLEMITTFNLQLYLYCAKMRGTRTKKPWRKVLI